MFTAKGWFNAHQDKQQLKHEVETLERTAEAREAALARRNADHARISERGLADVKALSQIPVGGCFDSDLPSDVQRLLSETGSD